MIRSLFQLGLLENQVLIEDCPFDFKRVKYYIKQAGIFLESCEHNEWNGKLLKKQIHHKNGIKKDCRIENLINLCPNCHSLTKNYAFNGRKHLRKSVEKWTETRKSKNKDYYFRVELN